MQGRFNVSYNDLNELAYPVLRHRMKLNFEAIAERVDPDTIIKMIIKELGNKGKVAQTETEENKHDAESTEISTETTTEIKTETKIETKTETKKVKKGLFGRK